jgi:hypothetical protein
VGGINVSGGAIANAAVGIGGGVAAVAAAHAGIRIPASIRCTDAAGPPGFVPFDFNPDKLTVKRSAQVSARPSVGAGMGGPSGSSGPITQLVLTNDIQIQGVVFEGLTTKLRCDTLLHWQSPPSGLAAMGLSMFGTPPQSNPPLITFQWGPPMVGFMYDGYISNCQVDYERFSAVGIPIRAKVTLTIKQQKSLLADLPTNPTSGGVAGRRTHVVRSGDTLQSIATTYYGKPGAWRPIAALNNIDDPTRVRPGRELYLPNAGELAEGKR